MTVSRGKPHGPGMIFTALAGYVTPPLLGLVFALLLAAGRITLMLWFSLALLAAMLIMIRNAYGALSVVATGAVILAVSWLGSATAQAGFAYLAAWFLLLAATRPVIELHGCAPGTWRRARTPTSSPTSPASPAWPGSACSPPPPCSRSSPSAPSSSPTSRFPTSRPARPLTEMM